MNDPRAKSLELLMDWSKWLVAIDAAALTLLSSLGSWHNPKEQALAAIGSIAFLISLIAATFLVGAIPVLAQRVLVPDLPESAAVKVHNRKSIYAFRYGPLSIQMYAGIQHYSFLLAAASITLAQVLKNLR
jgi:hypothetical protein